MKLSFLSLIFFTNVFFAQNTAYSQFKSSKKTKQEWKLDIQQRSTPILSLDSADYTDLSFLKPISDSVDVILLGESSHFINDYNKMRIRMIKHLHENLGFNVIAFETPYANLHFISENRAELSSEKMLQMGLYSIWRTEDLLEFMNYLKSHPQLKIVGFDCQETNLDSLTYSNYFSKFTDINPELGKEYIQIIKEFNLQIAKNPLNPNKNYLFENKQLTQKLVGLITRIPSETELIFHLQNLINNLDYFSKNPKYFANASQLRDSLMADNFLKIKELYFPNEKVIIWGHNAHVSKSSLDANYPIPMGEHLKHNLKLYAIGLYTYSGKYRESIQIKKPSRNNLELLLHENKFNYSFIDLYPNTNSEWLYKEFRTLNTSHGIMSITPVKCFDGIIFFESVDE